MKVITQRIKNIYLLSFIKINLFRLSLKSREQPAIINNGIAKILDIFIK